EVDHADSHPDRIKGPWDRIVPKRRNVHGPGRELKFRCPRERLRVSSVRPEDRQSSVEAACDGERSVRFEELGTRRVDFRLGRVGAERQGAADYRNITDRFMLRTGRWQLDEEEHRDRK